MSDQPQDRFLDRQMRKRHLAAVWARLAALRAGEIVLDVGSGKAVLSAEYARTARLVYALDARTAPHEPPANLIYLARDAADGIVLPAPPDVVFLTDTLHHAADPAAVLRAVRGVCGPQTRVLIAEYDPAEPGLVGAKPARRLAQAGLLAMLAAAGFTHGGAFETEDEHYAVLARRA